MGLFGSIVGGLTGALGSVLGASSNAKSIKKAEQAQLAAQQAAIAEGARQYDTTRADFSPYLQAGTGALSQINALLGIGTPGIGRSVEYVDWDAYVRNNPDVAAEYRRIANSGDFANAADFGKWHYDRYGRSENRDIGPYMAGGRPATSGAEAQATALDALRDSPLFQSLYRNGEEAVLQNAAATGGLRGGNTQRSLADFGADTFAQVIQQQLANLGGVANMGMGATGNLGSLGAQNSANAQNILLQGGNTRAGGILGRQNVYNNLSNQLSGLLGQVIGGF